MASRWGKMLDKCMRRVGKSMGDVECTVYRPDYTAYDQSGTDYPVYLKKTFRFDTQARKYSEPDLAGVFFYDIYGDYRSLIPGDILVPNNPEQGPIVTYTQHSALKAGIGVMTDQLGQICDGVDNVLYTNVRFQWAGPTFPGAGLNDYITETTGIPRRKAVVFIRQGIGMNPPIIKNMLLVETGNDLQYRWKIADIVNYNRYTILSLGESVG